MFDCVMGLIEAGASLTLRFDLHEQTTILISLHINRRKLYFTVSTININNSHSFQAGSGRGADDHDLLRRNAPWCFVFFVFVSLL